MYRHGCEDNIIESTGLCKSSQFMLFTMVRLLLFLPSRRLSVSHLCPQLNLFATVLSVGSRSVRSFPAEASGCPPISIPGYGMDWCPAIQRATLLWYQGVLLIFGNESWPLPMFNFSLQGREADCLVQFVAVPHHRGICWKGFWRPSSYHQFSMPNRKKPWELCPCVKWWWW